MLKNLFFMAALSLSASAALAGQGCEDAAKGPSPEGAAKAIASGSALEAQLNKGDDSVALIARMGQDLSEYNLTYSHLGYAVKKDDGTWVVVHKLNECGTAKADIFEQSLTQFFMDDLVKFRAGVWRLSPEVQARLKPELLGKGSLAFHEPKYNMVAYPYSTSYQNSNGWVLEVLTKGIDPSISNRTQALALLNAAGYSPSVMKVPAFKRLGARVAKANMAFDDQPPAERWAGRIHVATVDSVAAFLPTVQGLCKSQGCPEETVLND